MSFKIFKRLELLRPIHLIGGGGHAQVVAEAAELAGFQVLGFFDDEPDSLLGASFDRLGTIQDALSRGGSVPKIVAIGDLLVRAQLLDEYAGPLQSIVHPAAVVSSAIRLGDGSFVGAAAILNRNATIGKNAIVNTRAIVEHDCLIEQNVHVGPGAVLGGGVRVAKNSLVGINASVKPRISIGAGCRIGVGAVVTRDVVAGDTVVGVPARSLNRHGSYRKSA